jgi:predicted amidohydrolase YtcJ
MQVNNLLAAMRAMDDAGWRLAVHAHADEHLLFVDPNYTP